jgi:hypothetical protein
MYRIQSVEIVRTALILATMTAFLYAAAILILFLSLFVSWAVGGHLIQTLHHLPSWKQAAGIFLLVPPIVFVVLTVLVYPFAALFCFLYNQVAKLTGGIEFGDV